jgi:xanthine/CO dehydrogenase XdhC/CoxF family maturation factor
MEFLNLQTKLEAEDRPYVLATVVKVLGSASAKAGSKAIIAAGKNLLGWVGGGCAESFTISQAEEALAEGLPRVIVADLDDEVFGLGMPCGGKMEIFLEPRLPKRKLSLPYSRQMETLVEYFGFSLARTGEAQLSNGECLRLVGLALAQERNISAAETLLKTLPAAPQKSKVQILGNSRITEELANLLHLLEWPTEIYGLEISAENYPSSVPVQRAKPDYAGLEFTADSYVIVASHHKGDHEYIERALRANARYVGMVASKKRAGLVLDHLKAKGVPFLERVQSPAGVSLDCRNPKEIALSLLLECWRNG